MKRTFLIALSCVFLLTSCSVNTNDENNNQVVRYLWHIVNVTGGISGVDEQFSLDTIVWVFDELNGKLSVTNSNDDPEKEDGLDTGVYDFSIETIGGNTYLVVDDIEIGGITFPSLEEMILNENETSTGQGADGFIYSFQRTVEVVQ
ncbi:hypothetical protein [Snuella sedimenti]|uniref:Lipocalin-like domain-containing protein n=1 Tax=Snuella sedimenti TaxID=2798802 RepID=A0A8J7LSL3_9FLAO|nr:hypothetical protein [Snuella sedimenti]MBJ6367341.1 hypothetical protein [Snuella sedimenti]